MKDTIKRFGETVMLTNQTLGSRSSRGEWVEGTTTTTQTIASIEPMKADAIEQLPAGARLDDARIFYFDSDARINVGGSGSLATATIITYEGENYRVATREKWRDYQRATAVRITP